MRARLAKWVKAIRSSVDLADLLVLAGLVLIVAALWDVSRPAALGIPGVVLVWIALPPRPPFVMRGKGDR